MRKRHNKTSIDKVTLAYPVTIEGQSATNNDPSISKGSSTIKCYCHPNHKIHHTDQKSVHIYKYRNANSIHF